MVSLLSRLLQFRAARRPRRILWCLTGIVLVVTASAAAQFGRGRNGWAESNVDYNGRFTFTRLRYRPNSAWNHDYPRADRHLVRILKEITLMETNVDGSNVLNLDDPELFKNPIAYMSEPGFWGMTDDEAVKLREFLLKGGFLIFDDFERQQWDNMERQMRRVLPEGRFVKVDVPNPLFDSFFHMETVNFPHPMFGYTPNYQVIFEDNDPSKRVMVIANHDNDVAEYWEWSDTGLLPIDLSNEAYKLGVNYMIYGMTH
jgi:Domain of unknown function (DUF4159)